MAKKSQRRPVRYEREQSGCMWGLISIFDFRHGRSTQKLISDRRHGTRHAVGTGTLKNKLDNLSENCQGMTDGEESRKVIDDTSKLSVKRLIEEEMFSVQDIKKEINNPERDLDVSKSLESEQPYLHNSEKQSTGGLDIGEIMEDFCHQIHHKSLGNVEHDQLHEVHHQLNQKNPEFEEKLSEAIKLINEKLINWKHVAEDGNFHPSKELRDALQTLISDEELFPKLLQGPQSIMVKHVQSLWNAQVENDEESKSLPGSNLSDQGLHGFRHSDEAIQGKQHKFFRRKIKSLEKNQSKENKASQDSK
ncbi:hypothetical protein OIU76_007776 [Salix suchowensis]|nr:hypothetical protein OIU76_007776 [Salix suchowensis]